MNFQDNVDQTEQQTGEIKFTYMFKGEEIQRTLPTTDTVRTFEVEFPNRTEPDMIIPVEVTVTGRSQLINTHEIRVPMFAKAHCNYEFNTNGVSDVDCVLTDANGDFIERYTILGANEFKPGEGAAGGKILIEIDNNQYSETRSVEYTLMDQDLMLNLEADNESTERFRLRISNCYLYNSGDRNLLDFQEVMELAFFPRDFYNLKIRVGANGVVVANAVRFI